MPKKGKDKSSKGRIMRRKKDSLKSRGIHLTDDPEENRARAKAAHGY